MDATKEGRKRKKERAKEGEWKSVKITRARELMTRISEKYLCSRGGARLASNLYIIPTYAYINKETRLAKFPALSRVIKFKYRAQG